MNNTCSRGESDMVDSSNNILLLILLLQSPDLLKDSNLQTVETSRQRSTDLPAI